MQRICVAVMPGVLREVEIGFYDEIVGLSEMVSYHCDAPPRYTRVRTNANYANNILLLIDDIQRREESLVAFNSEYPPSRNSEIPKILENSWKCLEIRNA